MASFIFILGILLLFGDSLPLLAKFMMGGALIVTAFEYENLSSTFNTRSRRDYIPARSIRWK